MLKNTDKFQNSSHFEYDNKFINENKNKKDLIIFISVFVVGVLVLLGFAKILSPNVDVGIGVSGEYGVSSDEDIAQELSTDNIDERLKSLKQEDEGKNSQDDKMFSPEYDEKVILPKQKRKTVGEFEIENIKEQELKQEPIVEKKELPAPKESAPAPVSNKTDNATPVASQPDQIVNAKVVVGYYANEKQAEVAKTIIQDAGLGVSPIVKNMNGYYTLQVGAFNSKEKAQQLSNNLLKSNFPARVILE